MKKIQTEKVLIRNTFLNKRAKLSKEEVSKKSQIIEKKVLELQKFKEAKFIHIYLNIKNEVITKGIIKKGLKMSKRFVFGNPYSRKIENFLIETEEDLENARFLLLNKNNKEEIGLKTFGKDKYKKIDLVLSPLVSFDDKYNRIGMGGGWYDRFLPELSPNTKKIGLAYNFQKFEGDRLPADKHDQRLDEIITD